ncbi:3''-deamino-3''-oxonicotianamine reductase [Ranunculus cassubicifolius]
MGGMPELILNSERKIPVLGFGTAASPLPPPDFLESSFMDAIELGYRHFDTASVYGSEEPLGRAISQALHRRLIASRDELFITSKLWCTDADRGLVVPALNRTLKTLGLDYLDLYLIHWPVRLKGEMELRFGFKDEDIMHFDVKGTWQGMEECQRLGLTKSVGVSNFSVEELSDLLIHATIPPAVNQVEMHPYWQQRELRAFCADNNIHVSAYSPLGGKGAFWGSNMILDSKEIERIAEANGKSTAQVCLRWAFEQGVSFLPKSFNKGRMKENMEIFHWNLREDDLEIISCLPQQKMCAGPKSVDKDEKSKDDTGEETC